MVESLLAPENDYASLHGNEVPSPRLRVTIVIPVFNRVGLLQRTLAGVGAQTYPHELMSVVVADDGSEEDVSSGVEGLAGDIPLILVRREHAGYGAGQARNLGASTAEEADVLIFLDADCIPDPEAVERHVVWHHSASNLVVIGSRHHLDTAALTPAAISAEPAVLRRAYFGSNDPKNEDWSSDDHRKLLHRRTASLRHGDEAFRSLVSSNFSIRRDKFLACNGFSEDFHRWGGEDTELGWRLWNSGTFFIDEPRAAVFHQTQEDAGVEEWRDESRGANDGLIQSKIPHRFYRSPINAANEVPKVSVIVHSPDDGRLDELSDQIIAQRLGDLEMIFVGSTPTLVAFVERRQGDRRFSTADTVEDAIAAANGEFVALVHGSTALDHRLLSRSVAALEKRPRLGWVRSAYGIPTTTGVDIHRRDVDTELLDVSWADHLPLFGLTRRRELMKCLRADYSAPQAWGWVKSELEGVSHSVPLVMVPAPAPADPRPASLRPPTSLRSMMISDLKSGGKQAATAPLRALRSKISGTPFRATRLSTGRQRVPAKREPRSDMWAGRVAIILVTRRCCKPPGVCFRLPMWSPMVRRSMCSCLAAGLSSTADISSAFALMTAPE